VPLLDVVPNFATDIGRRILPDYADVIDRRLPGIPGAELNTS
jgi:hypothetical protein